LRFSLSSTGALGCKALTRTLIALMIVWSAAIGLPDSCLAGPTQLKLSLGLRQEYNDNIFFDADDETSDFITTGIFTVDLGHVAERLEVHAIGHWEAYTYRDNSELDDVNQDYRLTLDYRFTPRLRGSLSGAYIQDYQRDRETEATGVVFDNEERKRHQMETAWEYMLSEVTTLNLSGTYWHDVYERNPTFQEEYHDLEAYGGNVGLIRALRVFNRPVYGRLNLGSYHYKYTTSQTDNTYLNLGFSTAISETYTLFLDLGPRYTVSEYPVTRLVPASIPGSYTLVSETETSRDWGGSGRLSLSYDGEKTFWEAALSQNISASSGQSQAVQRSEVRFDWRHWFTWEWQGLLYLGYFKSQSDRADSGLNDVDEDTFIAHPRLRYRINQDWSVRGSYRYTWEKDYENDKTYQRNQLMIELVYNWPVWE
jgi:hypothetical protein